MIESDGRSNIKKAIWIFFYLLLFEGALRKWILPGLATPLLLIRDPIAMWIVWKAWRQGWVPLNGYTLSMFAIGFFSIYTAIFFGHGNLFVALYGSRILFLYFPMIFVIGEVFSLSDVKKMAESYLWISIPMTILITMQFYSPQSAWVNRGVGGSTEGAGFQGAMGFFRPPGTFSFATGVSAFYSGLACFVFYFWLDTDRINRKLLIAATICLLIAVPVSIIRALFFQVGITVLFMLLAAVRKPKLISKIFPALIGGMLILLLLGQIPFFKTATEAFTSRFTAANEAEGGMEGVVGDRYFGGMLSAFTKSANQPFWGFGSGVGTNVGGQLLTGKTSFYSVINGESEWQRIVGELGLLFGLIVIIARVGITLDFTITSYKQLVKNDFLPWMILPFCLTTVPQGNWGIPTPLGFDVLMCGLLLASLKRKIIVYD